MRAFDRLGLAAKVTLVLLTAIVLVSALMGGVISFRLERQLKEAELGKLANLTNLVVEMADAYRSSLEQAAAIQMKVLEFSAQGVWVLDANEQLPIGSITAPKLTLDGKQINSNEALPDQFTSVTGGVATVFARTADDFVRVTTSLKKEDGSRAMGTPLGKQHPAYGKLMAGERYTGRATLFGREYMTQYKPIKDAEGKTVGALFIGMDFTEGLAALKERIKAFKAGENGYVYVVDTRPGASRGKAVIHPSLEGKSMLELVDVRGQRFVEEMIKQKRGRLTYDFRNPVTNEVKERAAAYQTFEPWGMMFAASLDMDELVASAHLAGNLVLTAMAVLALLIAGLSYFCINRFVMVPLGVEPNEATEVAVRIAAGSLAPIEPGPARENSLILAMRSMVSKLSVVLTDANSFAASVATEAESVGVRADAQLRSTKLLTASSSAIAAAVQEMTSGISRVAESADQTRLLSRESETISREGAGVIDESAEAMRDIASSVQKVSGMIAQLNADSSKISGVITAISEIADQTNLLALNAAIEAARAGESGRGFAVVADEVRKLAERTSLATREISNMISQVQGATHDAVDVMETAVKQGARNIDLASQAADTIQNIANSSAQVMRQVDAITEALGEQHLAANEIANKVEAIADSAERQFGETEALHASSQSLMSAVHMLKENLAYFHM